MERLIDSSLWVDYSRPRTLAVTRRQAAQWIDGDDAVTCRPVIFEVLRGARPDERERLAIQLESVPLLPFVDSFWRESVRIGQRCRDRGFTIGALDLLIAAVALHHDAEIVTFDADYSLIVQAEPKPRIRLLARAA